MKKENNDARYNAQNDALLQSLTGESSLVIGGRKMRPLTTLSVVQMERLECRAWAIKQSGSNEKIGIGDLLEMYWVISGDADEVNTLCARYAAARKMQSRAQGAEYDACTVYTMKVVEEVEQAVLAFAGAITPEELEQLRGHIDSEAQSVRDSSYTIDTKGGKGEKNGEAVTCADDGDGGGEVDRMELT